MPDNPRRTFRRWLTWPNIVSLMRVPLAVLFWFVDDGLARALIIALAALSDGVDGWLARRLSQRSRAGELVDPVTDKVFVVVALAALTSSGVLDPWQLLVLLARDGFTVIAFIVLAALRARVHFRARLSGKIVTVLQLITLASVTVLPITANVLMIAVAAATLWAVVDYTLFGLGSLRRSATDT